MRICLVLAHPLENSLTRHLAESAARHLRAGGHEVVWRDLYAERYDPCLSAQERAGYYTAEFDDTQGLAHFDGLVLVFPTWWFGMPAILKGWIDRSFLPGVAYTHADDLSALQPKLTQLRRVLAITPLGSPAWVDWLVLRRPVARALNWGVVKACAPRAKTKTLSLYRAEKVSAARLARFETQMRRSIESHFGRQT